MQAMQDKDFDQLFRAKFEDAEIMPSANLWGNIAQELSPKSKPKRKLPVYWMAAALAVVAIGVGLLSSHEEPMQLKGHGEQVVLTEPVSVPVAAVVKDKVAADTSTRFVASTPLVLTPKTKLPNLVKENDQHMQPEVQNNRPVVKEPEVIAAVKETPKTITDNIAEQPVIARAAVALQPETVAQISETEEKPHRGIRNVGDVINYVVDKLDKRENKVIQFKTDDDEGSSSLVAINIGFLKFNSKKK